MNTFFKSFKNSFSDLFSYKKQKKYNFTISNIPENQSISPEKDLDTNIFSNIDQNIEFMKIKYNLLINSDVVMRKFILNTCGKQFSAFIFYIDGMVDQNLVNDFILKPLMIKNSSNNFECKKNKVISEFKNNNVKIRKVKKFNIINYIEECLIPQNSVKKQEKFNNIISGINSGNCALFINSINVAFDIDVKGFKQRSIDTPNNEIVIRGPRRSICRKYKSKYIRIKAYSK